MVYPESRKNTVKTRKKNRLKRFILFFIVFFMVISILAGVGAALFIYTDIGGTSVKKPVNLLVLVGDVEEANTDTMFVANYNPSSESISVLSIPRDTRVKIKGSRVPKINSAYAAGGHGNEGCRYALSTVEKLLGIHLDHYVYLNISTIRNIIDKLGGVNFDVPDDLDYDDPTQDLHIHLKKGMQHLDGAKTEQLLRFRHYNNGKVTKYYDGSDLRRIDMQQAFLKELIKQKLNPGLILNLKDLIDFAARSKAFRKTGKAVPIFIFMGAIKLKGLEEAMFSSVP